MKVSFICRVFLVWGGIALTALGQDCSASKLCATGCCSKFGFCGTTDEHCSKENCVANCDFKLGCDKNNLCKGGECCSKAGYCGLGPDYCAPANCAAGCTAKSYCDPGGYGPFAEVSKCPLNVCCSKWGYCGITKEFCGEKTVNRPSCPTLGPGANSITRVVGYYEGWSAQRPCNDFVPNQIPIGTYTHLFYAFATIDPVSFEVRLGSPQDDPLLRSLSSRKIREPGLKVFIAIGGWTFNDPGPTQTTFSDLVTSEVAQGKFIRSLISFLATYNLNGVDLDWEYPGPHSIVERGGRQSDYENLPKFLRKLKDALRGTAGRDGLSITLPASYWFLQHFDIVELENIVDFFNMMTYDLHGGWDRDNKWVGSFLNAHTNLTEIKDSLDLMWGNKIDPKKVVLGLAFYGRVFTASSSTCMAPGCTFASAGLRGACSREAGILMNNEIVKVIRDNNLKPQLFKEEAVKLATWDDQWVAFDDEETLKMKVDYAKGACLGGVMVWAVSHDTSTAQFSKALRSYTSQSLGGQFVEDQDPTKEVVAHYKAIDQCKWTNCNENCPDGYVIVERADKKSQMMWDDTDCKKSGGVHKFCCPREYDKAECGWYGFKDSGGKCSSTCPAGKIEVGSNKDHCSNKKDNYQVACCSIPTGGSTNGLELYNTCNWSGTPKQCDAKCTDGRTSLFSSSVGSGGVPCGIKNRNYCCGQKENQKSDSCTQRFGTFSIFFDEDRLAQCASDCYSHEYRLGMDTKVKPSPQFKGGTCKTGQASWCCRNNYTQITHSYEDTRIASATKAKVRNFLDNQACLTTLEGRDASPGVPTKDVMDISREFTALVAYLYLNRDMPDRGTVIAFNDEMKKRYPNCQVPDVFNWMAGKVPGFNRMTPDEVARLYGCRIELYNTEIGGGSPVLTCNAQECTVSNGCLSEEEESDDSINTGCGTLGKRDQYESIPFEELVRRGSGKKYCHKSPDDPQIGSSSSVSTTSSPWHSVSQWPSNSPVRLIGVFPHGLLGDCANSQLIVVVVQGNGYRNMIGHSEHIVENHTPSRFFRVSAIGELLSGRPNPGGRLPRGFVADAWINGQVMNPALYGNAVGGLASWVPSRRIYEAVGSTRNTANFVILYSYYNRIKNYIWMWYNENYPWSETDMQPLIRIDEHPTAFFNRIRTVMAIFRYFQLPQVRRNMIEIVNNIREELHRVNEAWNAAHPQDTFDIYPIWDHFILDHFEGMQREARTFVNHWLDQMELSWERSTTPVAHVVRSYIDSYRAEVNTVIRLDLTGIDGNLPWWLYL